MDDKALRILVVDDHRETAESLALLLESWGHDARQAYDGGTAIVIAHDFDPDIVLLDIGMPNMDGYEVARRLRDQLPRSHMHIIAVTGYGQWQDVRHAYEAGFDSHLVKPVDEATLNTVLAGYGMTKPRDEAEH